MRTLPTHKHTNNICIFTHAHIHTQYLDLYLPFFLQYYLTILEAIENATDNERILVHPGVYTESILLNKPVSLIGSSPERVLLVSVSHTVIETSLQLKNVTISNMEIKVCMEIIW